MIKYNNCLKNLCQLTKNNILVIGNGFDLACGLKTSYSDFVKYLVYIPVLNNYKMLIKYGHIKEFQSINELEKEIREEDKLFFFMALKTLSDAEKTKKILKMLKHPFIKDFFEVVFSIDLFNIILEPFSPLYNNSKFFSFETAYEFYGFKMPSCLSDFWNYLDVKKIDFNKGIYTCISIINSHLNYAKKSINGWLDVEQFIEFLVLNSKDLSLKFYPSYFKENHVLYSSPLFENPNLAFESYKGLKFFSKLFSDYLCCIYSKQSSLLVCREQGNNKVTKHYLLKKLISPYISGIKGNTENYIQDLSISKIDFVIDYNYTQTIIDIYSQENQKVKIFHVNGSVEYKNIVFGYTNLSNANIHKDLYSFEKASQRNSNNVNYFPQSSIMHSPYNLMIYGHSCSTADSDILKGLFTNKNLGTAIVFCYTEDDYESIKNNVRSIVGKVKFRELCDNFSNRKKNAICFSIKDLTKEVDSNGN